MQSLEVCTKESSGTLLAQLWSVAASPLPFLQSYGFLAWGAGCIACLMGGWTPTWPGNFAPLVLAPLMAMNASKDFGIMLKVFMASHCFLMCCSYITAGTWAELPSMLAFYALLIRLSLQHDAATSSAGDAAKGALVTLRMLLDLMSDGFFVLGTDGTIVGTNLAAQELLGGGNLEGMSLPELLDKAQTDGSQDASNLLGWGLSSGWAHRLDRSRVKLEMYTVPCRLPTASLTNLLEHDPSGKQEKQSAALLCAVRHVETQKPVPKEQPMQTDKEVAVPGIVARNVLEPSVQQPSGLTSLLPSLGGEIVDAPTVSSLHSIEQFSSVGTPVRHTSARVLAPLFFKTPWRFESVGITSLPSQYKLVEEAHCHVAGFQLAETLSGGRVAVKEIALAHMQCQKDFPLHLRAISREADTLKNMSWASPVVIRLMDCWLLNDFTKACLVTEWLPLNLANVLEKLKGEQTVSVDKHKARRWFAHAATGIAAIHAAGFVHCDVQPCNLWLTEDMQRCKVAGLGISKPLKRKGVMGRSSTRSSIDDDTSSILSAASDTESVVSGLSILATLRGSNGYSSPEMIMERRLTESTDIFSLGCVLLEMLTLAPMSEMALGACEESSPEEAAWSLVADARVRCFEVENVDLQSLAVNCADLPGICVSMLNLEPGPRPTASDIVARSQKLQAFMSDLVSESSKLRAIILRESRRVHFNPSWLQGDVNEQPDDECCDSGSELTPAVA